MNVRVSDDSYRQLRTMALESGETLSDLLTEAIDALFRRRFVDAANAAYARLKQDEKSWRREIAERAAWDATLADGLREI